MFLTSRDVVPNVTARCSGLESVLLQKQISSYTMPLPPLQIATLRRSASICHMSYMEFVFKDLKNSNLKLHFFKKIPECSR
jgi:hypothetical protein